MNPSATLWTPPPVATVAVRGLRERAPVARLFFVGRNYHAHAVEMGRPVDKSAEVPFYFTKSPSTLVESGATVPYPPRTQNYHYEMELVVVVGKPGFRVAEADAHELIYGYACGLDMTRRDLQLAARAKQRPWDLGKDVEQSAAIAEITKAAAFGAVGPQAIRLTVDGALKQDAVLDDLICSVDELVSHLSHYYHLRAGDLIYTGTPAGVGPVEPGQAIVGTIDGLAPVELTIGQPE